MKTEAKRVQKAIFASATVRDETTKVGKKAASAMESICVRLRTDRSRPFDDPASECSTAHPSGARKVARRHPPVAGSFFFGYDEDCQGQTNRPLDAAAVELILKTLADQAADSASNR